MGELAWRVLEATLAVSMWASVLMGGLWLGRRLLSGVPAWAWTLGWALVWMRLVVPFNLDIPWSLLDGDASFSASLALAPWHSLVQDSNVDELMRTPVVWWQQGLVALWLCGAAAVIGFMVQRALCWRDQLTRIERLDDGPLFDALLEGQDVLGLGGPLSVWSARGLAAPVIHGIWRPRVMVPERFLGKLTAEQWRCVVTHELAHVKHRDVALGWLATAAMALHWFNPLVWMAWRSANTDRELAADARAIKSLGADHTFYGNTLLEVASHSPPPTLRLAMAPGWRSSGSVLRTRVTALGSIPSGSRAQSAGLLTAAALVFACGIIMTQRAPAMTEMPTGWQMAGSGRTQYLVTMDRTEHVAGHASARLQGKLPSARGYGTLMQSFDAAPWHGKRVRVSAVVRSDDVTRRGDFWVRVQAPDSPPDGPGLTAGGCDLRGTQDWKVCDVLLDVPARGRTIQIGVGIDVPGALWIDDVRREEIGARTEHPNHAYVPFQPHLTNGVLE